MGSPADLLRLVIGGDGESELPALHGGDLRLRPHLHADGGGGVVGDVQPDAHSALVRGKLGLDGVDGGVFHQGNHIRGGKYRHQPRAHRLGGVFLGDHGFGAALHAGFD